MSALQIIGLTLVIIAVTLYFRKKWNRSLNSQLIALNSDRERNKHTGNPATDWKIYGVPGKGTSFKWNFVYKKKREVSISIEYIGSSSVVSSKGATLWHKISLVKILREGRRV